MTKGLFNYPQKAAFGRVLPKSKVFAFAKAARRLRDLFAAEINQIVWRFKLAPETVNLPAGPGITEIQIFGVELKAGIGEVSEDILHCIDAAIVFPIFFEVTAPTASGDRLKVITAYKRPSEADASKWVVGDYFSTDWLPTDTTRSPLPVALNLTSLYEQMLRQLMPIGPRPGESLQALAERHRVMAMKQRELEKLEAELTREKQFNRKVALNAHLRAVKAEVDALADGQDFVRMPMTKLKMHTPDSTEANIARIAELFPNCVTESKDEKGIVRRAIDFDQLRQELSDHVVEGPRERYHLDWPGKRKALLEANAPIAKTLRPCREESVDFDTTKNLFIEGENLDALKLLQETYLNKVKLIYIDPPYNTGRNLLYKNDYSESTTEFLDKSMQQAIDGTQFVTNLETNGRFHSNWLSMIYPRLKLARNLLAEDGVLVCTIDENEQATLDLVLKELFKEGGYEHVCVTIVHNPRGIQGTNFSYTNEYAFFVYPRGTQSIGSRHIPEDEVDWSQLRNWGGESARTDAKNCFYPVLVKNGTIIGFGPVSPDDCHPKQTEWKGDVASVYPIDRAGVERKWRYARQSVEAIANLLRVKKSAEGYEIEIGKDFGSYRTVWIDKRYDANEYGTKVVNALVEGAGFTFPKSLWAVYDCVQAVTAHDKDAIVLDFFAGSSTTAHAVMKLNADDGGNRRFIMVQFPEQCDVESPPFKRGLMTIADISKERIRRAGKEVKVESGLKGSILDIGCRVLKVDTSNMKDVYYQPDSVAQATLVGLVDNIKGDRKDEDLLFQVLLDWGVDLTLPIKPETITGKKVYFVDTSALAACFEAGIDEAFIKELAKRKPLRAVFRDTGYGTDATKINVEQVFKLLSPGTEVKSI